VLFSSETGRMQYFCPDRSFLAIEDLHVLPGNEYELLYPEINCMTQECVLDVLDDIVESNNETSVYFARIAKVYSPKHPYHYWNKGYYLTDNLTDSYPEKFEFVKTINVTNQIADIYLFKP
jgi:hypothetical protein